MQDTPSNKAELGIAEIVVLIVFVSSLTKPIYDEINSYFISLKSSNFTYLVVFIIFIGLFLIITIFYKILKSVLLETAQFKDEAKRQKNKVDNEKDNKNKVKMRIY